jgi:putative DNA primase/helicase
MSTFGRESDEQRKRNRKANGHAKAASGTFNLVCLADVEPEPIEWLWEGYFARGKLTLIGGDPDLGKSQISIDVSARLSRGLHWPNGARAPLGSTIFLCSEDGVADTVRPRAEAAGADLAKLFVLDSSVIKNDKARRFNLQDDLDTLAAAINRVGDARLINIDALSSYVGRIDNNSQSDVRQVLDPLSTFAGEKGVSIVGIMHPPKGAQANAIRAFAGSFAYIASGRLAFFASKEPETDRNLLLAVKNNLGPKASGKGYRIASKLVSRGIIAPYVLWDDAPVDITADQAIAAAAARRLGSSVSDARDFLRDLLADGPVDHKDLLAAARANCISERTLDRAKAELKIKSEKDKGALKGGWKWGLP